MGFEDQVSQWFVQIAYQPNLVYLLVTSLMFASAFGLPLPEEVTIISSSLTAYMANNPDKYPPPTPDAVGVNAYILAAVCFFAVFLSDYLIFWLGVYSSERMNRHPRWSKYLNGKPFLRGKKWINEYGILSPLIFRFTPGLRFPGHLMCGAMGIPRMRFIIIVGLAAAITIPTQVLLISTYGDIILQVLGRAKFVVIIGGVAALLFYIAYRWQKNRRVAS